MANADSIDHVPISEDTREVVRARRTRGALIAGAVGFGLMGAGVSRSATG